MSFWMLKEVDFWKVNGYYKGGKCLVFITVNSKVEENISILYCLNQNLLWPLVFLLLVKFCCFTYLVQKVYDPDWLQEYIIFKK